MVYVPLYDFKIVLQLYWRWCSAPPAEWQVHEWHTLKFSSKIQYLSRKDYPLSKSRYTWLHYFNFSDCAMQLPSWHNHNPVLNWVWGGQRACWSTVSSNKLQQSGCVGRINSVQLLQIFSFLFRAFIRQNCIRNKYTDPMSKEMTSGIPEILFWERRAQKKSTLKHWVFPWCGDICPVLKCLLMNRLPPHHFYSHFYQFEYTA